MNSTHADSYESICKHLSKASPGHRWIDAGEVKTRYIHAGDSDRPAPTLLHGTAGSLERYCANMADFGKNCNVYAIDLLGSGFTDKPDRYHEIKDYIEHLSDFMKAVGADRTTFIGCSLGTLVAARLSLEYPEKIHYLIFNAPFGHAHDAEEIAGIRNRRWKD